MLNADAKAQEEQTGNETMQALNGRSSNLLHQFGSGVSGPTLAPPPVPVAQTLGSYLAQLPHEQREKFELEGGAAELRKKRMDILIQIPRVDTPNPIAALTNFCRHYLKFDVSYEIPEPNTSADPYKVEVYFPELVEGQGAQKAGAGFTHSRKKFAKEEASKLALRQINQDENFLEQYIYRAITQPMIPSEPAAGSDARRQILRPS